MFRHNGLVSKKSKKKRQRRSKGRTPAPRRARTGVDLETLWEERRAGARNLAGVTYQIAVTAHLLVAGRAGALPIVSVVPEGLEDVDCVLDAASGGASRLYVQSKERVETGAAFGLADFADFLVHALEAAGTSVDSRLALVTNGRFGSGLGETGWEKSVVDTIEPTTLEEIKRVLPDLTPGEAEEVLARTHLVRVPFDVGGLTTVGLADAFDIVPAVASLVVAKLSEDLTEIAAAQRSTLPTAPARRTVDDLVALVNDVVRVADATALMKAELKRILVPLDLRPKINMSSEDFLAGVDVRPGHISAHLDVPRPAHLEQIIHGLEEKDFVLVVGASGAGKSALVWRSAYSLSGYLRPFRLSSVRPNEVNDILDYVDALAPSEIAPVLICADDLGRPATSAWEALASALVERPGVKLLGAAREEDFRPSLAAGRAVVVRPFLDRPLASAIAQVLRSRGVTTRLSVDEAFARSGGLLMEFLTLMVTGNRLEAVVGEQIHSLLEAERTTDREALRYICAAHVLGTGLVADALPELVPHNRELPSALERLSNEHFVLREDGETWRGLHELRSDVVTQRLHKTPPPTTVATWARLLTYMQPDDRPHVASRVARITDYDLEPLTETVASLAISTDASGVHVADLLQGFARADALRHAKECFGVIRSFGPPKMGIVDLLRVLAAKRFRNIDLLAATGAQIDPVFYRMADALPNPPDSRKRAVQAIGIDRIVELVVGAEANEAARLLETCEGTTFHLREDRAAAICAAHSGAPMRSKARLGATLIANGAPAEMVEAWLGDISARLQTLRAEEIVVRDCSVTEDTGVGRVVSLTVLTLPAPESDPHGQAVDMARIALDLCPEASVAEIITLGADGERYTQQGNETAYKRLPRENLPRAPEKTEMSELMNGAAELTATKYWTDRLRDQAEAFADARHVLEGAAQRLLDPRDNGRAHWAANVDQLRKKAAALPSAPLSEVLGPVPSEQDRRRQDPASEALQMLSAALGQLVAELPAPPPHRLRGIAAQLRRGLRELERASVAGSPVLADVGDPLPPDMAEFVASVADLLVVLAEHPDVLRSGRRFAKQSWTDLARIVISEHRDPVLQSERESIERAMAGRSVQGELSFIAPSPQQLPSSDVVDGRWVVMVDVSQWDSGSFLEDIPADEAQDLGERVLAMPTRYGMAIPAGAVVLRSRGLEGISSAQIRETADQIGLALHEPHTYRLVNAAVPLVFRASGLIAATQIGTASAADESVLDEARALLEEARRVGQQIPATEVAARWSELCEAIELEVGGGRRDGLAAQVARVVRGEQPGDLVLLLQQVLGGAAFGD